MVFLTFVTNLRLLHRKINPLFSVALSRKTVLLSYSDGQNGMGEVNLLIKFIQLDLNEKRTRKKGEFLLLT